MCLSPRVKHMCVCTYTYPIGNYQYFLKWEVWQLWDYWCGWAVQTISKCFRIGLLNVAVLDQYSFPESEWARVIEGTIWNPGCAFWSANVLSADLPQYCWLWPSTLLFKKKLSPLKTFTLKSRFKKNFPFLVWQADSLQGIQWHFQEAIPDRGSLHPPLALHHGSYSAEGTAGTLQHRHVVCVHTYAHTQGYAFLEH